MLTRIVDISVITGQRISGPVTNWQTQDGPLIVEHLAGRSPDNNLHVFYHSPLQSWQTVNVSQKTGQKIVSPVTSWVTQDGPRVVEHLAGHGADGSLYVFWWAPGQDWHVVNVSQITGKKVASPVTSWVTPDGQNIVEHLAGMSPRGDLLVFYWSPRRDWQVVNVSQKTGQKIASPVTSWVTQDGPKVVENLAGHDADGSLYVFRWAPGQDWQMVNVSQKTGKKIASPVTSWVVDNAQHLAGQGLDNSLLVFWRTPATDWGVTNATTITGEYVVGMPTAYQLNEAQKNVHLLGAKSLEGSLLLYWWTASLDWQVMNVSDITGQKISSTPQSWLTREGDRSIEHFASEGENNSLLVFSDDAEPRRLTDGLSQPYKELKRTRHIRRKVLAILWDPHRPDHPALPASEVESLIFGELNSVKGYYLENSNGYFTIEVGDTLGWYDADKPADHYFNLNDPDISDGWRSGHVEKWAEAIRKAARDFNFKAYDTSPSDNVLNSAVELTILIIIPQNDDGGYRRGVLGREVPREDLIVDGVKVTEMVEVYLGRPPVMGTIAHELSHILLNLPDMYFNIFMPFAANTYSLMDEHRPNPHLDPFNKMKLGWLRPRLILRSGRYTLPDVETRYVVWILMDPKRPKEYFIVENRWPGNSYDRRMADVSGGLGVWHIIEDQAIYGALLPPPGVSAEDWAKININEWGRRGIRMIRPVLGNEGKALWDGADPDTGYDLLSIASDRKKAELRWADGTPSGFELRSLSSAGPMMTVTVKVPWTIGIEEIQRSYREVFGRDPWDAELTYWINKVGGGGMTYEDVVSQHIDYLLTPLGAGELANLIKRTYRTVFGRDPWDAELNVWIQSVKNNRLTYAKLVVKHVEFLITAPAAQELIEMIKRSYRAVFGREPGEDEILVWMNAVKSERKTYDIVVTQHIDYMLSPTGEDELAQMIRRSYLVVLMREPNDQELASWKESVRQNRYQYWQLVEAHNRYREGGGT